MKSLIAYAGAAVGGWLALRAIDRRIALRFDLRDKVVLVTGASRGLGLVLARELVARGAKVAICARTASEVDRARADLVARGGTVAAFTCDVTNPIQLERLVAETRRQLGPIDALINNAGVIQVGPMEHMTLADYENAMATHFWAPLHLVEAVLPEMMERGAGRIVNIASIGGKVAVPHMLPYSASKFALVGLSEGLQCELAKRNIHVTTVVPGLMRTGSPLRASFKGRHGDEYHWFAVGDSLHVTSMSAERAARQIIDAMRRGDPEIVLSVQARLALALTGIAPSLARRIAAVIDRFLPGVGGSESESASGLDSYSSSWFTRASMRAARRNHEV